jgi:hypothetical protein
MLCTLDGLIFIARESKKSTKARQYNQTSAMKLSLCATVIAEGIGITIQSDLCYKLLIKSVQVKFGSDTSQK